MAVMETGYYHLTCGGREIGLNIFHYCSYTQIFVLPMELLFVFSSVFLSLTFLKHPSVLHFDTEQQTLPGFWACFFLSCGTV